MVLLWLVVVVAMRFRAKIVDLACLNHFSREYAGVRVLGLAVSQLSSLGCLSRGNGSGRAVRAGGLRSLCVLVRTRAAGREAA